MGATRYTRIARRGDKSKVHHFDFRVSLFRCERMHAMVDSHSKLEVGDLTIAGGPTKCVSSKLAPDQVAYWLKLPEWTSEEAAALLCGVDPDVLCGVEPVLWEFLGQPDEINKLRRRIERMAPRDRRSGVPPGKWLALAKKYDICVPLELETQVGPAATGARICDETACKEKLIELMKNAPDDPIPKSEVHKTHFSTLPKRTFNRAWTEAIRLADAPKWSAPGARKKSMP